MRSRRRRAAANLARIAAAAEYEIHDDPRRIAEYLAQQMERADGAAGAAALRRWAEDRDAFFAQPRVGALGWKA